MRRLVYVLVPAFILISCVGAYYASPKLQSRFYYYKQTFLANTAIKKDQKELSKVFAEEWPIFKDKVEVSLEKWPTDLQWVKQIFHRPILLEASTDRVSKAYIMVEGLRKPKTCPTFPAMLSRDFRLTFKKHQSRLIRYEYTNRTSKILVETRRAAFHCDVEVLMLAQR